MRILLLTCLLSTGCTATCDGPQIFAGRTYDVFGNLVRFDAVGVGAPIGVYPVNGATRWSLRWGVSDEGPVQIDIDGQTFDGTGSWSSERCGAFELAFDGAFSSEEGVRHIFETEGDFLVYGTVLEGRLTWDDRWTFGESSGTITAEEAVVNGALNALAL